MRMRLSFFFLPLLVVTSAVCIAACQRTPGTSAPPPVPVTPAVPAAAPVPTPPPPSAVGGNGGAAATAADAKSPRRVVVELTEEGFKPDHIPAEVGKPVTLVITRKSDKTCAREILFKGQAGKTELPLNKEVEVTYTPKASGKVPFGCAMGMMVGGVVEVR